MSSEIVELIQKRDKIFNMFNKTGSTYFYKEFCSCRNKTQRDINKAKSASYFENKIEENKNNPKNIWKRDSK